MPTYEFPEKTQRLQPRVTRPRKRKPQPLSRVRMILRKKRKKSRKQRKLNVHADYRFRVVEALFSTAKRLKKDLFFNTGTLAL